MDEDVRAAVESELLSVFDDFLGHAHALDGIFAADVAERLASFTLRGGRRTRSRFLWWATRACGGGDATTAAALRVAAALELIQTCALVHDDVADRSAFRRGAPSFHAQVQAQYQNGADSAAFGVSTAVLAGDLALAWADDLLAAADLPPGTRRAVNGIWRSMRTEMVAGQYLDLHGQATGSQSMVQALRMACLKTARYTVERPMVLGAALAGADAATTSAVSAAGRCVGIAFQLRDDLLGVVGDPTITGKPTGDDVRSGKPTYLVALARARAAARQDAYALAVLDRSLGDVSLSGEGLARVRAVLERTGALARVERRIARLVTDADRHLRGVPLHAPAANQLTRLLYEVASPQPGPDDRSAQTAPPLARPQADGGVR
ncbi:polyprenyl synthetase family protein [Streptomyces sp. NBC_01310]|nr:polyprenyl synthetase family protein [Streptomyces sp. NBC_01310]